MAKKRGDRKTEGRMNGFARSDSESQISDPLLVV